MSTAPAAEPRTCLHCGKALEQRKNEPARMFSGRMFCSFKCGTAAKRVRAMASLEPRYCLSCNTLLERKTTEDRNVFLRRKCCDKRCATRLQWRWMNEGKTCTVCGKQFRQRPDERKDYFRNRMTCDPECAEKHRAEMRSNAFDDVAALQISPEILQQAKAEVRQESLANHAAAHVFPKPKPVTGGPLNDADVRLYRKMHPRWWNLFRKEA